MHQEYRLVWFQHLQKAAGSTIIQMAIQNDETLFSVHENGNPCYRMAEKSVCGNLIGKNWQALLTNARIME